MLKVTNAVGIYYDEIKKNGFVFGKRRVASSKRQQRCTGERRDIKFLARVVLTHLRKYPSNNIWSKMYLKSFKGYHVAKNNEWTEMDNK